MATETTEQIVREAPEIEAYKLGLLKSAQALQAPTLPDYQVAGMTPDQINALATGRQGIGAFQPYLEAGSQALTAGQGAMGEAADILRGADTRGQFAAAQQAYNLAAEPAAALGNLSNVAGSGMGYIGQGNQALVNAQEMARLSSQANLAPGQQLMSQSVGAAQQAAAQPGFGTAQGTFDVAQQAAMGARPSDFTASAGLLGKGLGQSDIAAQQAAQAAQQAGFGQSTGTMLSAAQQSAQAAQQPGFQQGIGTTLSAAQQAAQAAQQPGFQQGLNTAMTAAQRAQLAAAQPGFDQAQQTGMEAARASMAAAQQPGFGTAQGALQSGIGALQGAAQGFDPSSAQAFMNPYQQQVIDEAMRQIDRQGAIQQQGLNAQAVRAGAFGGSREGIQRQELGRNLAETRQAAIVNALQQGYGSSMQQAQQAFEQQQQRQLSQGQGLQGAAGQAGSLAAQQAGLQQQGAQALSGQAGLQASIAAQRAGLGQSAAQQLAQAAQLQTSTAAQQAGLQQAAAQQRAQAGQLQVSTAAQQAGLGQNAAQQLAAAGQQQASNAAQQGALGLQAAQQRFQAAGYDASTAMNMAQLEQTQQGQAGSVTGIAGSWVLSKQVSQHSKQDWACRLLSMQAAWARTLVPKTCNKPLWVSRLHRTSVNWVHSKQVWQDKQEISLPSRPVFWANSHSCNKALVRVLATWQISNLALVRVCHRVLPVWEPSWATWAYNKPLWVHSNRLSAKAMSTSCTIWALLNSVNRKPNWTHCEPQRCKQHYSLCSSWLLFPISTRAHLLHRWLLRNSNSLRRAHSSRLQVWLPARWGRSPQEKVQE
jgi:hypothetical protein